MRQFGYIVTGFVSGLLAFGATAETCVDMHCKTAAELATLDFEKPSKAPPQLADTRLKLREIRVTRQNVFPVERHWLARQANRFHVISRESSADCAAIC